ncbi:DUF6355 family natural product biosynthesis protein [Amycolatopsis sp. NPDC098790]|uniref:DUF6355 family natural product biosynthesis protein n=1 Tax=Amycolatopsis sp. NPDC098790 TaxID=3363939 RepID=UPI00380822E1
MFISTCLQRASVIGAIVVSFGCSAAVEASALPISEGVEIAACGYDGGGEYIHCDNGSGSTVMLDVQDIFFNLYHYCVGPGTTNLQPVIRWRVIGAWWNGGVGCDPGYYGPA